MQRKFLSGGGISQIYPPPEGAVDSRVRTDHRYHRPGYRVEEKWGHTAALRAPVALPRHYLCCTLV